MKTVTTAFNDALKTPSTPFVRQIWYKRRYWVESSKSYTWETNWTQLIESKVAECSQITWQLDIQQLNQFQTSNITITLENLQNQWRYDNPYGIFAKDGVSPVFGYQPFWMKFQVRAGLIETANSNTTEVVPVFTGVATEFNFDTISGTVQVTVSGEESLLINANAEAVSTSVVNETATGSVDGSNKIFTTAHNGVGIVSEVSDNGITKRAGADYSLTQLNDSANPGKITFVVAPTAGHTIRVSYLYWKTSQKFEDLVTLLLNQAGIPGANQSVSPVIFPSNIINSHAWQTQSDWVGGSSLTLIDTSSIPNSIAFQYDTASTINDATTGWTSFGGIGGGSGSITSDTQGLKLLTGTGNVVLAQRSQTNVCGDWQTDFQQDTTNDETIYVVFMANTWDNTQPNNNVFQNGYRVVYNAVTVNPFISLQYWSGGGGWADLALTAITLNRSIAHTIRVRRNPGGLMRVYLDGALVCSATETTFTTSTYFGYYVNGSGNVHFNKSTAYLPQSIATGTWISSAVDFGSTPTAWSQFQFIDSLNSGTVSFYTATSADNITYDAYVAVPSNGQIASTLRRYVKVKAVIDITSGDPSVSSITIGSITSSTVITLANFTGMTCYDAITALGQFCNYEFGFAPTEVFYFRPKIVSNIPVFTMDQTQFNLSLDQVVNGYDRVYSSVRATYGGYIKDIADDGLTSVGPLATVGFIRQTIDGGSILISSDADVATGAASSFFNYFKYPRRRVKVTTKVIPQLDLSDVVRVTLADNLLKGWYIGDTSVNLGDATLGLYGGEEQVVYNLTMKVIGMRIDTNTWLTQFDLEEVI